MYFNFGEINLFYESVGEGIPVFMLHGNACDHRLMKGCMEPIFCQYSGFKRIYVDLPGMGNSIATVEVASADNILKCLCLFIQSVADEAFLLVGESYGGYLANGLVNMFREKVAGIVLICPVVYPSKNDRKIPNFIEKEYDEVFLETLLPEEKKRFCEYAVIANEYTYQRYRNEVESGLKMANSEFILALEEKYEFHSLDIFNDQEEYHCIALIVVGKSDNCVGYQDAFALLNRYINGKVVVIEKAGHNLQIEQPLKFNALVEEWIMQIQQQLK